MPYRFPHILHEGEANELESFPVKDVTLTFPAEWQKVTELNSPTSSPNKSVV